MDYEILIFAIIAVLLFAKLWQVLGRRNEGEQKRPNPFARAPLDPVTPPDAPKAVIAAPNDPPVLLPIFSHAPASLAGALAQLQSLDAAFDEKQFLRDRKTEFQQIVTDFAKGDLTASGKLMAPDVLTHFKDALAQRLAAGQALSNRITRMVDAEVTKAVFDGKQALVTVQLVSNQENVLRDAAGRVIGGVEGKIEEITDLWTYRRDMTAKNAPWLLAETRS